MFDIILRFLVISIFCLSPNLNGAQAEFVPELTSIDGRQFQVIDDMLFEIDSVGPLGVRKKSVRTWPDGIMPIKFEAAYLESDRKKFFASCKMWEEVAAVSCRSYETTDRNYILVRNSTTVNNSKVGMIGGEQIINLASRQSAGIIAHEIAHAAGFTHQHNSPERDYFVEIVEDRILDDKLSNFEKLKANEAIVYGFYDFCSIMHYKKDAFSKATANGDTIIPRVPVPDCIHNGRMLDMGQREYLTVYDKIGMATAYGRDDNDKIYLEAPSFLKYYGHFLNDPSYVLRRFGVNVRFGSEKPFRPWCTEGVCEWTCYWSEVVSQSVNEGSVIEYGSEIKLKVKRMSEAQSGPPPRGKVCN